MILILPLFYLLCAVSGTDRKHKCSYFGFIMGIVAGAIYSFCSFIFTSDYKLVNNHFLSIFFSVFFENAFLPLLFLFLIFFAVSKNSISDRYRLFIESILPFYFVFLPFTIIHSRDQYDFFLVVIYPLLRASSLVVFIKNLNIIFFDRLGKNGVDESGFEDSVMCCRTAGFGIVLSSIILFVALILPSVVFALYTCGRLIALRAVLEIIYCASVCLYFMFFKFCKK